MRERLGIREQIFERDREFQTRARARGGKKGEERAKGKRSRNKYCTHSRKVRERPIEGVASGAPARVQERVLVVLVEPLLDFPQQLVVGYAPQSVREFRRVAKVKRHCR